MMVRAIVLLAVLTAPGPVLAQPDVLSEEATRDYRKDYEFARMLASSGDALPKYTENVLRGNVVSYWYKEHINTRIRWFQRQDWPQAYKVMFMRAVQWRKDTFNGGPEKLYRLSKEYQQRPNAERDGYLLLSSRLLGRAAMSGHEKAMKEALSHPIPPVWPPTLGMTPRTSYPGAISGQLKSIVLLAAKYLSDPIFDDDRTKGFYWYLRVDKSKLTKRNIEILQKEFRWITPDQRKLAKSWITNGHVPPM